MKKRIVCVFILVFSAALLFAGGEGEQMDDGTVTLRMTIVRDIAPVIQELIEAYRVDNPHVEIQIDSAGDAEAIREGIPRLFNSDDAPDISFYFHGLDSGYPAMKRANILEPLNSVYEEAGLFEAMSDSLLNQYLTTAGNDGNYYAVPWGGVTYTFLYTNAAVFAEAGIVPPQGLFTGEEEFREHLAAIESAGITPIAVGYSDTTMAKHLSDNLMVRMLTPERYGELQTAGIEGTQRTARFTDPDVVAVHEKYLEWSRELFPSGVLARSRADSELLFVQGRAAIFPDGLWQVANFRANAPDVDYGWFAWPQIRSDITPRILGFYGDSFIVSPRSRHVDVAKDFVRFVVSREGQEIVMASGRLPIRTDFPPERIMELMGSPSGEMLQFTGEFGMATGFHDSHPIELQQGYVRLLQDMVADRETPQSVGEKAEALAQRLERGE